MKIVICLVMSLLLAAVCDTASQAQTAPVPDQNPSFAVSRDRYVKIADSLNAVHGITVQQTYKAIDYLADKRDARQARRAMRNDYRLQRSFIDWPYDYNNYSPFNRTPFYHSYRPRYYSNNYLWTTLPLAFMLGRWSR